MNNRFGLCGYEPELVVDFSRAFAELGFLRLFSFSFLVRASKFHVVSFRFPSWETIRGFQAPSSHTMLAELNRLLSRNCHSDLTFIVNFENISGLV